MAFLQIESLSKRFGATTAVERFDLRAADGELVTLLGPSGSGKTTVLRIVAGHVAPDAGRIVLGGREVQSLPPERRDIGMVFQSYALFPHRNVFRNVAFGLERRRVGEPERRHRVTAALERVRLGGLETRFPHELSGGQQQRVALARALVIEPAVLLLDEPLGNLDAKLRETLRLEIRRIQKELAMTTLLVTHDQEEALAISDRVAVMNEGRLQQVGTPERLYHHPETRFVAEFIGRINLLAVTPAGEGRYRTSAGALLRGPVGGRGTLLGVRPEALRIGGAAPESANRLRGRVTSRRFLGERVEIAVDVGNGTTLSARCPESDAVGAETGAEIELWWSPEATTLVPD